MAASACPACITKEEPPTDVLSVNLGCYAHMLRQPKGVAGREDSVNIALLQPGVLQGVVGSLYVKLKVGLPVLQVAHLVGFRRAHYSRRSTDICHVYLPVLRIKIAGSP